MNNLQFKNEFLPLRCEICHQSDCFDAITNFCQRCDTSLAIEKLKQYSLTPITLENAQTRSLMPFSSFLALSGTISISLLMLESLHNIAYSDYGLLSQLFWVALATSYLFVAWFLLLATKRYCVVQEIIALLLCFIFGAFIIIMWISIASNYPPQ
jgi:hypothetical protein